MPAALPHGTRESSRSKPRTSETNHAQLDTSSRNRGNTSQALLPISDHKVTLLARAGRVGGQSRIDATPSVKARNVQQIDVVSSPGAVMSNSRMVVAALMLVCTMAAPAVAQERPVAGRIKVSTGAAFVVRDGAQIPAELGQNLFETDGLRTGVDGKIGVTLNDDTRLSLGPNSELKLERFTYAPADSSFGLALKFIRGAATYVSGRIAKFAPDSIRLETPAAIVGVRGTTLAISVLPE